MQNKHIRKLTKLKSWKQLWIIQILILFLPFLIITLVFRYFFQNIGYNVQYILSVIMIFGHESFFYNPWLFKIKIRILYSFFNIFSTCYSSKYLSLNLKKHTCSLFLVYTLLVTHDFTISALRYSLLSF